MWVWMNLYFKNVNWHNMTYISVYPREFILDQHNTTYLTPLNTSTFNTKLIFIVVRIFYWIESCWETLNGVG